MPIERGEILGQLGREMHVLPAHRLHPAAAFDVPPGPFVRAVHDQGGTVGVGQQDRGADLLAGDGHDGVALGGADAPVGRVGGGGGAGSGGGGAQGAGWVGFDLVALFVVGGDDGLEFGEVDF